MCRPMEKAEGQPRRPPHRRKQYLEHGGRASRRLCTPGSMSCAICRARAAIGTSSNRHHRSRRAKIPNSIGQDDENAIVDTSVVVELGGAVASRWLPSRRRTCGGWGGSSTPPGDSGGSAATATICTPWRIGSSLDPAAGQSNFCRGIKVEMGTEFIDIEMGQGVVAPFGNDLAPNFDSWSNAGHFNSPDPVLPDCRSAPPRSRP